MSWDISEDETIIEVDGSTTKVASSENFQNTVLEHARKSGIKNFDVKVHYRDNGSEFIDNSSQAPDTFGENDIAKVEIIKARKLGGCILYLVK